MNDHFKLHQIKDFKTDEQMSPGTGAEPVPVRPGPVVLWIGGGEVPFFSSPGGDFHDEQMRSSPGV